MPAKNEPKTNANSAQNPANSVQNSATNPARTPAPTPDINARFTAYLNANLPRVASFHPHFNDALAWVLAAGGKHFRAQLVLGVVAAFAPQRVNAALPVALGVEFLHTYSLIHDDLPAMDDSPLRRGVATLHVKFDEVTAILAGDALNTEAFLAIARADLPTDVRVRCVEILAANGGLGGMVIGQAIDCFFERKPLGLDELIFLHNKKTGALIAASMQLGAVIAGLDAAACERVYRAGLGLGLAFQIHDDLLDATADAATAGKPTGHDSAKNSFTNLLGVAQARAFKARVLADVVGQLGGASGASGTGGSDLNLDAGGANSNLGGAAGAADTNSNLDGASGAKIDVASGTNSNLDDANGANAHATDLSPLLPLVESLIKKYLAG